MTTNTPNTSLPHAANGASLQQFASTALCLNLIINPQMTAAQWLAAQKQTEDNVKDLKAQNKQVMNKLFAAPAKLQQNHSAKINKQHNLGKRNR